MIKLALVITLCAVTSAARADGQGSAAAKEPPALTKLPFGYTLGKTTGKELAKHGTCSGSKDRPCGRYTMLGGKFTASLNEDDTLMGLAFATGAELPQAWKDLGLQVAAYSYSPDAPGTPRTKFLSIIKAQGATSIEPREQINAPLVHITIHFAIGDLLYTAQFTETDARPGTTDPKATYATGLVSLEVTEGY